MTLGEKIKKARRAKRITQEALAHGKITRNMISRIEGGKANPSIDTIRYIASRLSLPVSYFLSEDDDLFFYQKAEIIKTLYNAYEAKEYSYIIDKINSLSGIDNEIALMMAQSYYELGKLNLFRGSLSSATDCFNNAQFYCEKTVFDTTYIKSTIPLYASIASNIQAPLLEFDSTDYLKGLYSVFDYDLYKYVTQDYSFTFNDPLIKLHVKAKLLIKERIYQDAVKILSSAEEIAKTNNNYNAFIVFGIYTDMENCYKQLYDFENAYKYSSKRMSMIEGFKS